MPGYGLFHKEQDELAVTQQHKLAALPPRSKEVVGMLHRGRFGAAVIICGSVIVSTASAMPMIDKSAQTGAPSFTDAEVTPVVVFGKNSRRGIEDFAATNKLDLKELKERFTASGLVECGTAHGAGQLTLADDVVTTAAHVFYDEHGAPRARSCSFVIDTGRKLVRVPIDLSSIVAGSKDPYSIAAVNDWAVARLTRPVAGVTPYALAGTAKPRTAVSFIARGHIDWGEGRKLSMERCMLHDQLAVGPEGTREFSFDCETGDGASGGAVVLDDAAPTIGAILVGWRSNKPFRSAPFSRTHYNFVVTIEGAFKQAVVSAATKVVAARSSSKDAVQKLEKVSEEPIGTERAVAVDR